MVPTGVSLLEFLRNGKGSDIQPIGLAGSDGWGVMLRDVVEAMYHDLEPQDGKYWASRILKHSSTTRSSSENVYAGWKDVLLCYLRCTQDRASDPGTQRKMIDSIRDANPNVTVKYAKPPENRSSCDPNQQAPWYV
jgi:hypothetical protein